MVPVRYLIRDEYGVLFFRNLAQVERWLRIVCLAEQLRAAQ